MYAPESFPELQCDADSDSESVVSGAPASSLALLPRGVVRPLSPTSREKALSALASLQKSGNWPKAAKKLVRKKVSKVPHTVLRQMTEPGQEYEVDYLLSKQERKKLALPRAYSSKPPASEDKKSSLPPPPKQQTHPGFLPRRLDDLKYEPPPRYVSPVPKRSSAPKDASMPGPSKRRDNKQWVSHGLPTHQPLSVRLMEKEEKEKKMKKKKKKKKQATSSDPPPSTTSSQPPQQQAPQPRAPERPPSTAKTEASASPPQPRLVIQGGACVAATSSPTPSRAESKEQITNPKLASSSAQPKSKSKPKLKKFRTFIHNHKI